MEQGLFDRTRLLFGDDLMERLKSIRVIIFGVGGVGSWCAESLIRSGIGHLTVVDSDQICVTNINRQLMATTRTVGQIKVEVLKNRLLEINPDADILALRRVYEAASSDSFQLETYDYIIDAIDSLENKAELIRQATKKDCVFFSSMGAALKLNPLKIQVAEFWKVKGCPLAAALRKKMKKSERPSKKFKCVFSDESSLKNHDWGSKKTKVNGTLVHVTAIFGFTLAGLVIQDLYARTI